MVPNEIPDCEDKFKRAMEIFVSIDNSSEPKMLINQSANDNMPVREVSYSASDAAYKERQVDVIVLETQYKVRVYADQ